MTKVKTDSLLKKLEKHGIRELTTLVGGVAQPTVTGTQDTCTHDSLGNSDCTDVGTNQSSDAIVTSKAYDNNC